MRTNSEFSGSVGFDVKENLQYDQGYAIDVCSRSADQNTAESRDFKRQNSINERDRYGYDPITAVTKLQVVAAEVEVECNFDTLAADSTEYSSTNALNCHAIGGTEKQTVLDLVELRRKWSGRSGLYVAKRAVAKRAYGHNKLMGVTLLSVNGTFLKFVRKWHSARLLKRGCQTQLLIVDELHK